MSESQSENEDDRVPSTASDDSEEESNDLEEDEDVSEPEEPENLNQDLRCVQCNSHFTTIGGYNRHMARHNIQKNGLPFPHVCQYCSWGFVRADHLNNHKSRCKHNPTASIDKKYVNNNLKIEKPKKNIITDKHLENVLKKLLEKKYKSSKKQDESVKNPKSGKKVEKTGGYFYVNTPYNFIYSNLIHRN